MAPTTSTPQRKSKALDRKHQCSSCPMSFKRREHWQRHVRSHTKEKPFSCTFCGKTFSRKDLTTRHQRTLHADGNSNHRRTNKAASLLVDIPAPAPPRHEKSSPELSSESGTLSSPSEVSVMTPASRQAVLSDHFGPPGHLGLFGIEDPTVDQEFLTHLGPYQDPKELAGLAIELPVDPILHDEFSRLEQTYLDPALFELGDSDTIQPRR